MSDFTLIYISLMIVHVLLSIHDFTRIVRELKIF